MTKIDRKYFATWRDVCRVRGWKSSDDLRYAFHRSIDVPESHLQFTPAHWDRVFPQLKLLLDPDNLNAALKVVSYLNHDAAQAAHQPIIRPGLSRRRSKGAKADRTSLRTYASKYERITGADDPGERKRLRYVIERLFEPRLIDTICRDRWTRGDWQDLPLPQLTELRDLLKTRLSKFITKVKRGEIEYDFGFSLVNPWNGHLFSNADIIAVLLRRGAPVRMGMPPTGTLMDRLRHLRSGRHAHTSPEPELCPVAAAVSAADQDPF